MKPPPGIWKSESCRRADHPEEWQAEMDKLSAQKDLQYQQMKAMREEIKAVESLRKVAEKLEKEQPDQSRKRRITSYEHSKTAVQKNSPYGGLCFHFPNKSLCVPVRASVSTSTSSSMR